MAQRADLGFTAGVRVVLTLLLAAAGLGAFTPRALAFLPASPTGVRVELPARPEPQANAQRTAPELEARAAGRWSLQWDPWSGAAARGWRGTPPVHGGAATSIQAQAAAETFVTQHAALLGTHGLQLLRVRCEYLGRAWYVTWRQQDAGRDVLGCNLTVVLDTGGTPIAFWSTLVPGLALPAAAPGYAARRGATLDAAAVLTGEALRVEAERPIVVPLAGAGRYTAVAADQLDLRGVSGWRWQALADAGTGQLLALESRNRTVQIEGQARGDVLPFYAQDTPVTNPLQWLGVTVETVNGTLETTADASGAFSFAVPTPGLHTVESHLAGLYVYVVNEALDPLAHASADVTAPGSVVLHFGTSQARLDERTIYYHTNVVHDFAKSHFNFTLLDFSMRAVASVVNPVNGSPNYANAYWDGNGINFGNGGGGYSNFGEFADVIYHEYVHGITDFMYQPVGGLNGGEGGAIHEALSDYFACTITGEPLVGENLSGPGTYFRNLENNLRWPDDAVGEVHGDGEILGGALWDLRELTGAAVADQILHFARTLYPQTFADYSAAVMLQDDVLYGDGAPGNGSPHLDAITTAFGAHGIGPAASRTRALAHASLGDTEDAGAARDVHAHFDFGISSPLDTLILKWSAGGPYLNVRMQRQADGSYIGQIPGQPDGTDVHYWLTTQPRRGYPTLLLPAGAPASTFAYHVGVDTQPPVVTHVPRATAAACSWPAELVIDISDNLGLAYAYVGYTQNGVPGPFLGLLRDPDDRTRYTTTFSNVGVAGDTLDYWIVAQDASRAGNAVRRPESGTYRFVIGSTLAEDFESGGPWSHRSIVVTHPDSWHVTDAVNHTPAGTRAWVCGVDGGEYPPSTAAELLTDTYFLGTGAHAAVWSRMDAETNGPFDAFDGGLVQLQVAGDPAWITLVPDGGYNFHMSDTGGTNVIPPGTACFSGRDADWRELRLDLAAWNGKRVRLRFLFGADNVPSPGATLRGWSLDDFTLDPGERSPTDVAGGADGTGTTLLARPPGPNPGRPQITFSLRVPASAGRVQLDVYDVRGRLVRRLLAGAPLLGPHDVRWDGRADDGLEVPAGVYCYRLASRLGVQAGRVVVLR